MKKLLIIAAALAMALSFLPKAEAGEAATLGLTVSFDVEEPVISIELNPTEWVLEGVKLGERRRNVDDIDNAPIHNIANTGNVPVLVDIGYGPYMAYGIHPGLEQGLNTFITGLGYSLHGELRLIPPNGRRKVANIDPDEKAPLHLMYGAPTELSGDLQNHGVTYELRASGMISEDPDNE